MEILVLLLLHFWSSDLCLWSGLGKSLIKQDHDKYIKHSLYLAAGSKEFIGVSMSEPLSSDLNVKFVCLPVCLSVMDGP